MGFRKLILGCTGGLWGFTGFPGVKTFACGPVILALSLFKLASSDLNCT